MANEEQLEILKQGVEVWNKWLKAHRETAAKLIKGDVAGNSFEFLTIEAYDADLEEADLSNMSLANVDLGRANLMDVNLRGTNLSKGNLRDANLKGANLNRARLTDANLSAANLVGANLREATLLGCNFSSAILGNTAIGKSDLRKALGLENIVHISPSSISADMFALSNGEIPDVFLKGCGLSDWEIEAVKLHSPELSNEEINRALYRIYDLRATQALQISPLFVSYNHADSSFVDKIGDCLREKGIRYWRDIHDAKAGKIERQIDLAMRQNPTVLLVLSSDSIKSDWVEHEARTARALEKELGRDILCPIALDDSWTSSAWPKRLMEQVLEYNILDFSDWENDSKFEGMFRKLIDGLELFYKG